MSRLLFPQRVCVNCGANSPDAPLCPDCLSQLVNLRRCPDCATFIAATEAPHYRCHNCRAQQRVFRQARAALPFQGKLRDNLHNFKYNDKYGLRRPLAGVLLAAYQTFYCNERFDAVVPVPLSAERLLMRGYNQSEMLSELLCAELHLPHCPELLHRVRNTEALAHLNATQRKQELRGAFAASATAQNKRILLIDDIFTTGATVSACSHELLRQGTADVCILTVASVGESHVTA